MIHLHRHSEFSRLDGIGTAKQYAFRAAELGQYALAQTDHGTLSGALHHIAACREAKILPISGVEAYFRPDRIEAKKQGERRTWHLCLFAKNLKGWHTLLTLVSKTYGEVENGGGFYQYPCLDWDLLERHHEGLACSTSCVSSWLSHLVELGHSSEAREYLQRMKKIFGDDLWIEIMPHDFEGQRTLNIEIIRLATEMSIPLIATNDAHFPYKEWATTHKIAKLCGASSSFEKAKKDAENGKAEYLAELNPTLYLAHEEEMRMWFAAAHPEIPERVIDEAIANTHLFVQRTTPFLLDKTDKLPRVAPTERAEDATLRQWIAEGLERIGKADDQEYLDRVDDEYLILKSKGVIAYFVMVGKIVRWAKSRGIRVGLGRGSAAGCLISYLVGIVNIDPIAYGLLFERFLNPERKGLPDIDLDFQSDRRDEVKRFIQSQHWCDRCGIDHEGSAHVADIITHQRFQPKSTIQAVCRVYDIDLPTTLAITKPIDIRQDDEETTLEEILPMYPKLQELKEQRPDIWEHCLRLEGQVKNAGKHAAGVIITPQPIANYMPTERSKQGGIVTSWSDAADFPVVSDYGFLKIDALGIAGLQKHDYACKLIKQRTGEDIDLNALPALSDPYAVDPEVMEGFAKGWTVGVFQFGSRGITKLTKQVGPESIHDLSAINALYRPGPMKGGTTWEFPERKNDHELRTFLHPDLEPFLGETYGIIAYQEQVMSIYKNIAKGATAAEADDLRKAMGKLYRIKGGSAAQDFMRRFEEKWFAGCEEHGWPRETAEAVWQMMLEFGHYGFNKSHAESYALQAYQDMWLKINYPLEFYAAFLTHEEEDEKIELCLREMRVREIEVDPPDVNASGIGYSVENGRILLGLAAIEGIGGASAQEIIKHRPYDSFEDFCQRCPQNPKPLILAGATDSIADRAFLLSEVSKLRPKDPDSRWYVWEHIRHNERKLKKKRDLPEIAVAPSASQLDEWEREALAVSDTLAVPPEYEGFLDENIYTQDEVEAAASGSEVIVGGVVKRVMLGTTKKNDPYANVVVQYGLNEWTVKFWSQQLTRFEGLLTTGNAIVVNGKKDEWNGFTSVVCYQAAEIKNVISADAE